MSEQACSIHGCQAKVYAPAGTGSLCKEHFLDFVKWRRRKGPGMFHEYGAMTMEERNALVTEWAKTIRLDDLSTPPGAKR